MKKIFILLLITFTIFSCVDLNVENINNPDVDEVLSTPEGVKQLTGSLFNTWFKAEQHNISSPGPAMWVMADWGTVTFANYATVDMSKEPREALKNNADYSYHAATRNFWRNMYSVLTSANDILKSLNNNVDLGDNKEMIKGMAYFMQGLSNGYIGLVYDQGFPSDETVDDQYETVTIQPYSVSIDMAITELEKAISVFENNTFTLPTEWMNGEDFTNEKMTQIAHSFIARLMVYSARNIEETNAIDWQKVLTHAQAGITEDFNIQGDGNVSNRKWMSWYKYYMARSDWGKVDMRIVHMLDNTQPAHWPEGGVSNLPFDGTINSLDNRANTDFQYDSNNSRPERGLYRWSTYRYKRFDSYINADFYEPIIMMRKAENDLFIAEAYARTNQYNLAKEIINNGTRTSRGNLFNITNDPTEVDNAIIYERTIELPLTGMGIEYFDMRRTSRLQDGSLLHFPIPAQQLQTLNLPIYTFGGLNPQFGVPNQDVAVDGWYKPE
jgi:hypothetical protein